MDGFKEKKWFVYIGDHHEGPLSIEEIQQQLRLGRVSLESFVWVEGMADWKIMTELPEFQVILKSSPPSTELLPQIELETSLKSSAEASREVLPVEAASTMSMPILEEKTRELNRSDYTDVKSLPPAEEVPEKRPRKIPKKRLQWVGGLLVGAGLLVAFMQGGFDFIFQSQSFRAASNMIFGFCRPQLLSLAEKFPGLEEWVSPIPPLDDVTPEDFEELKSAARGRPEEARVHFAIALSKADPLLPAFYITSNLPEGAQFEVYLIGTPDTLLSQISFGTQVSATLSKKLAKTAIIRFPDGRPIPRGEYVVYVVAAEAQPPEVRNFLGTIQLELVKPPSELPKNARILVYKTYFLGGARDSVYASRLKEFHNKLREKTMGELVEVKQFMLTLENQLDSTIAKFVALRKGKASPKQGAAWQEFHNEWMKLQGNLDQAFLRWHPDSIQKDFFYWTLYQQVQKVGQAVEKVHGFQHSFFSGVQDPKSFEIQLGEATSSARSVVTLLKTRIEQAEKLPLTPNGMPRREGL